MEASPLRRRNAVRALGIAFLVGAGLVLTVAVRNYRAAHNLLESEPASRLLLHPEGTGVEALAAVVFQSRGGGRLAGWYVPSRNRAAVIVTHGTNADRSTMLPEIRLLAAAGFGVLAFDWPGLGQSDGRIAWDAGARDAVTAAVDWLVRRPDVDPQRIGGLGFSIGAFVMSQAASGDPRLRAVVLEGTPSDEDDYRRVNNGRWGLVGIWAARFGVRGSGLLEPSWSPIRLVGAIAPRPVLFIGGTEDREIPPAMAQALFAAAQQPKQLWLVPGAQHGHYIDVAPVDYPNRLIAFYTDALLTSRQGAQAGGSPPAPTLPPH